MAGVCVAGVDLCEQKKMKDRLLRCVYDYVGWSGLGCALVLEVWVKGK